MVETEVTAQDLSEGWDALAQENMLKAIGGVSTRHEFEVSGLEYARQVASLLPNKPQLRLLEVGCGVGRIMKYLAWMSHEIHGVDVSREMVGFAEGVLQPFVNAYVHWVRDEALGLFEDSSFDFAYSIGCFIHCEPDMTARYIESVRRVLKPGGRMYFDVHALASSADANSVKTHANRVVRTRIEDLIRFREGWALTDSRLAGSRFVCTFTK
jgi:cyclopropane fatty-acyl-phospholipid synthase-like methyltransferase